jgi:hypothetical protein
MDMLEENKLLNFSDGGGGKMICCAERDSCMRL